MSRYVTSATALLSLLSMTAAAQDPVPQQKLFEAGQYQQIVESTPAEAEPPVIYLAAQSQQKLGANDQASELYGRLAARGEGDPWGLVGLSAQRLIEGQLDTARELAHRATAAAGEMTEAHYQLGLVEARRQDWRAAASAFDRAAELNPTLAYAHYYGGLMHYRAKRFDQMAIHFDQFLKLAPEAPERPEVLQIMKTVRR
jgi:tetratricopeptide (TPR) repeat protein